MLTDTLGWILAVEITAASVQDRDGAKPLRRRAQVAFGRPSKVWADSGYSGQFAHWVKLLLPHGQLHLEIVRSPKPTQGCAVQPRSWIIVRRLDCLTKCRRLVKEHERLLTDSAGFIHLGLSGLVLRSLAR